MKKGFLSYLFPLLTFACLLSGCSKKPAAPRHEKRLAPVAVRYDLPRSFCLSSVENHKAIIVRTSKEFNRLFAEENFVSPYRNVTLPPIDFGKYDLFYVQGETTTAVGDLHADMITKGYPYRLWVYVQTSMLQEMDRWSVGYLVQKDDWNDQVKLQLILNNRYVDVFTTCSEGDKLVQPITYSLPDKIQVETKDYKPVLIKSEAEFNTLFRDYKDQMGCVDFSKYDFVYMQGVQRGPKTIKCIESWIDTSGYPYQMHVYIQGDFVDTTTKPEDYLKKERWAVAFLLPKSDYNKVEY